MKEALPDNIKISKEAKECVQECVGEFIAFITSEASYRCKNEKRKTVNGEDLLHALEQVGFDDYRKILEEYLRKYKNVCFLIFFFLKEKRLGELRIVMRVTIDWMLRWRTVIMKVN